MKYAPSAGLGSYIYAPKADAFLRKRWREAMPDTKRTALERLAAETRRQGLQFGVGLSPYELYKDWNAASRGQLASRIKLCNEVGADILALLFDDMRGDQAELATLQAEIAHVARAEFKGRSVVFCPTYYSDDPILDKMFGSRPDRYLETLGRILEREIGVIWTGPKICSKAYPLDHLERVSGALERPLWIWDNYPVNDGPKMCPFLHLRPLPRPQEIQKYIGGMWINPMSQATLSRIPIGGALGELSFVEAATRVLGDAEFGSTLEADLPLMQDRGLEQLTDDEKIGLRARYERWRAHPAGSEILAWLAGDFRVTAEQTFLSQ